MASTSTSAHPIRTLREYVTTLEAAITLCLANPKPKPVHRLRTTTRRIEGQLAMLALLPDIPAHAKFARKASGILKELRRAAGKVRDLDVQMDLIEAATPDHPPPSFEQDAEQLKSEFEDERDRAAKKLGKTLKKHQVDVTVELESLLDALDPAEALALSPTQLTQLVRRWYSDNLPPDPKDNPDDPDHLHALRKNAKLARYMAENAPKPARSVRKLAGSFEEIQEAGGHWHDWLVLAEIAGNRVGRSSPLTRAFTQRCHMALTIYKRHLREPVAA